MPFKIQTMRLKSLALLFAAMSGVSFVPPVSGAEEITIWPAAEPPATPYSKGDAFEIIPTATLLQARFSDKKDSDDYVHFDLGKINLQELREGGCVEVVAEIDKPVVRIGCVVANPATYWEKRGPLEEEFKMEAGPHTYRFYFDNIRDEAGGQDPHAYFTLHDPGKSAPPESATIKISRIAILPPVPDWREEKVKAYSRQFHWPEGDKSEPLYAEKFDLGVDWAKLSSSPLADRLSLDGSWKKKYFGEKSWDLEFLAATRFAKPDFDDSSWEKVTVPEPAKPDQEGGYYWYRHTVDITKDLLKKRLFIRFDDLASDARIYVNGQWVGSQTSVEKQVNWMVDRGSARNGGKGKSLKELIQWSIFTRCDIPCPFKAEDIPDGRDRLALQMHYGEFQWPLAYEVTPFLHEGKNVISIRLYGSPIKGWWIYRNRSDRAGKHVFGILGDATLLSLPRSGISAFTRIPPGGVEADGMALHRLECTAPHAGEKATARFQCGDQAATASEKGGKFSAEFRLPAQFADVRASVVLLDGKGGIADRQEMRFNTAVVEAKGGQLLVNGEPFVVRGINGDSGIEWNNDRTVTRREFLRLLRLYQQLGINAIRLNEIEAWQMEAAFQHGMMVMPVCAPASTDWCIGVFGQLQTPDISLAVDRHRLMLYNLSSHPNILMWNIGNELHHTPGCEDHPVIETYLEEVRQTAHKMDPYSRPVTYANFDVWAEQDFWRFTEGQDVYGQNIYVPINDLPEHGPQYISFGKGKPVVFPEWGTELGEKARKGKEDQWEAGMRKRWEFISTTPGAVGGFLYAWHGEMNDTRGRKFLQDLYLPYRLERQGDKLIFTNRSEATMRQVSILLVSDSNVAKSELFDAVPCGGKKEIPLPRDAEGALEIGYDSHRGLKHFTTTQLTNIATVK